MTRNRITATAPDKIAVLQLLAPVFSLGNFIHLFLKSHRVVYFLRIILIAAMINKTPPDKPANKTQQMMAMINASLKPIDIPASWLVLCGVKS